VPQFLQCTALYFSRCFTVGSPFYFCKARKASLAETIASGSVAACKAASTSWRRMPLAGGWLHLVRRGLDRRGAAVDADCYELAGSAPDRARRGHRLFVRTESLLPGRAANRQAVRVAGFTRRAMSEVVPMILRRCLPLLTLCVSGL
jgi:hypothetical protein